MRSGRTPSLARHKKHDTSFEGRRDKARALSLPHQAGFRGRQERWSTPAAAAAAAAGGTSSEVGRAPPDDDGHPRNSVRAATRAKL